MLKLINPPIAQLVEQLAFNERVVGSNPTGRTMQTVNFKSVCQELRIRGHTLSEISRITQRPKTTVYFHVKTIPHTEKLLEKIRVIRSNSIKGKGPQKGKSLLGYKYKKFNKWTPPIVNLVAHMLFDGAIRSGGILYYNRSQALIKNFRDKMLSIYNGKPRIYKDNNDVIRLAYHNVELGDFFKNKSLQLLEDISKLPISYQREFLKAFFDDEGSVDFRLNSMKRRVKGYQQNTHVLNLVQKLLNNFKINSYVDGRFNEIMITKQENIKKFAKEINFSKGLRINGSRSNSIWKKSLEKRKILAGLVNSYR